MVFPIEESKEESKMLFSRTEICDLVNFILDIAAKSQNNNNNKNLKKSDNSSENEGSSEKAARGSGLDAFFWAVTCTDLLAEVNFSKHGNKEGERVPKL